MQNPKLRQTIGYTEYIYPMTLEGCGNRTRRLYFDIDASQEGGHGAMVFHVKRDYNHTNLKLTPPPQQWSQSCF